MDEIKNEMVIPYTIIPNEILRNNRLSLKQKGMMCYLLSLPKDWVIFKSELQKHFTDGRDSISVAIDDLVDLGYITKKEKPKEQGKFNGFIYIINPLNSTVTENPNWLTVTENPSLINTNKENTNKELISSFEKFWALYPNKTEKKKSFQKWMKLKQKDIDKIFETIENFIKNKPFPSYNHPNPSTYINNERWNDEIPTVEDKKEEEEASLWEPPY